MSRQPTSSKRVNTLFRKVKEGGVLPDNYTLGALCSRRYHNIGRNALRYKSGNGACVLCAYESRQRSESRLIRGRSLIKKIEIDNKREALLSGNDDYPDDY